MNNGSGNFENETIKRASFLKSFGMFTDAHFYDWDQDGDEDLMVTGEFMGIEIFENNNGQFSPQKNHTLSSYKGWWNTLHLFDVDNDGDDIKETMP